MDELPNITELLEDNADDLPPPEEILSADDLPPADDDDGLVPGDTMDADGAPDHLPAPVDERIGRIEETLARVIDGQAKLVAGINAIGEYMSKSLSAFSDGLAMIDGGLDERFDILRNTVAEHASDTQDQIATLGGWVDVFERRLGNLERDISFVKHEAAETNKLVSTYFAAHEDAMHQRTAEKADKGTGGEDTDFKKLWEGSAA